MAKPLVSDELWEVIRPLLPPPKPRRPDHPGRKPLDDRPALTGIVFVLKTASLGRPAPGDGLRLRHDLLASPQACSTPASGPAPQVLLAKLQAADKIDWSRAGHRQQLRPRPRAGEGSGPNPTDRGRPGVKHHVLTDAGGVPLQADITAANVPDVKELLPLVDSVPPVRGKAGPPPAAAREAYADRAYDSEPHRPAVARPADRPEAGAAEHGARQRAGGVPLGGGGTLSWLHGFRKLRSVTEKGLDMQYAFLDLAMCSSAGAYYRLHKAHFVSSSTVAILVMPFDQFVSGQEHPQQQAHLPCVP